MGYIPPKFRIRFTTPYRGATATVDNLYSKGNCFERASNDFQAWCQKENIVAEPLTPSTIWAKENNGTTTIEFEKLNKIDQLLKSKGY